MKVKFSFCSGRKERGTNEGRAKSNRCVTHVTFLGRVTLVTTLPLSTVYRRRVAVVFFARARPIRLERDSASPTSPASLSWASLLPVLGLGLVEVFQRYVLEPTPIISPVPLVAKLVGKGVGEGLLGAR